MKNAHPLLLKEQREMPPSLSWNSMHLDINRNNAT